MSTFFRLLWLALLLVSTGVAVRAQDHLAGDFKFKYGFDAKTSPRREDEGSPTQKLKASFKIYLSPRISLTFANDDFVWKEPSSGARVTGIGNSRLSFDADIIKEDSTGVRSRPAISFEYNLYLPTGSKAKGLSSGKADHEIVGAVSKSFGDSIIQGGKVVKRTNFEADFGGYFTGNSDRAGFTSNGELNLSITQTLDDLSVGKYTYHGEIDSSSAAKGAPSEIFSINELAIALPKSIVLTVGVRNGITPNSPRFAIYSSITLSGSFHHKPKP